ncbi:MMPL family transporter [Pseudonocardiaceae bacterium YIM PH 21723]|nr:MMPL family transporter [Pseudonocardiaceae bacterium YIM PH 21723]
MWIASVAAGIWGLGVFGQLGQGGYEDPGSASSQAAAEIERTVGAQSGDVVAIYTMPEGRTVADQQLSRDITAKLAALPNSDVLKVQSYWNTPGPQFVSPDKRSGAAMITLAGETQTERAKSYARIKDSLGVDGAALRLAGSSPLQDELNQVSKQDMVTAEAVSMPITLILLVIIFGGLVAASLPVIVGGLSVFASLGVLHLLALHSEVSSFGVNVASLLGLATAIDYGLFIVGRYREEMEAGHSPEDAVWRTVATAGRTIAFSSTLLIVALSGLLFFPQAFLKSLAYGGMSAVAIALLLSLTLLPALLGLLGTRVDKLAMPWRRHRGRHVKPSAGDDGIWAFVARKVMRRPLLVAVPIIAGLLLLGTPFLHIKFGQVDETVLPEGNQARQSVQYVKDNFPALGADAMQVVVRGKGESAPGQQALLNYTDQLKKIDGVKTAVPVRVVQNVALINVLPEDKALADKTKQALADIKALPAPDGSEVLVGGITARVSDSMTAIRTHLPSMIAVLVGATLLLMFLAFGSVILPIKAVLMSAASLSATYGTLVWIFQDGHLASWLGITPSPLEPGVVVFLGAVVFGLSTDYEVFLLSRMVEARNAGASTRKAVEISVGRTASIITAAALLLIVVTGAFAFSGISMMKFTGVGMIFALILDATIIRILLVPATVRLLGDLNWWAPGPLRKLQDRIGLHESGDLPDAEPRTRELATVS